MLSFHLNAKVSQVVSPSYLTGLGTNISYRSSLDFTFSNVTCALRRMHNPSIGTECKEHIRAHVDKKRTHSLVSVSLTECPSPDSKRTRLSSMMHHFKWHVPSGCHKDAQRTKWRTEINETVFTSVSNGCTTDMHRYPVSGPASERRWNWSCLDLWIPYLHGSSSTISSCRNTLKFVHVKQLLITASSAGPDFIHSDDGDENILRNVARLHHIEAA
jgi:hypothetical protein